ncbi:MAG: helix-turn-helix domain-containing protein [Butyrivibrio sp.]|nr:helix-turn-helix domain-containing protein [Butyrivibrio sp.]
MKKNNVKRLRSSRNLSQTDMAKELRIPQTRISAWELGKSQISEDDAEMLAEYFGVTAAYI